MAICYECGSVLSAWITSVRDPVHPGFLTTTHDPRMMHKFAIDPHVPKEIRDDYREAILCLECGAYNAAAVMGGRAIEASCNEKRAPKTITEGNRTRRAYLNERIEWLYQNNLLPASFTELAKSIKTLRDRGAHPQKIPIRIDFQSARRVVYFTQVFLFYLYGYRTANSYITAPHSNLLPYYP